MKDNIENIQQSVLNFVADYEEMKAGHIDLYEKMLRFLEAPYNRMPQHDQVIALLRQTFTEEDIRAWFCFPDFDYRSQPLYIEEACAHAEPADQPGFARAVQNLIDHDFLLQAPREDGTLGYMRTYMLYLAFGSVLKNDHAPLTEAFIDWWMHVLNENAHLRTVNPEHRVLPHEASLTGAAAGMGAPAGAGATGATVSMGAGAFSGAGAAASSGGTRISMNLEIPDTREILPTDLADAVLRGVDHMAVIDCVCRAATEARNVRSCDYPIEGVCFLFNEAANEAIKVGYGREVTNEEGIELMHRLRDMGLIQVISNSLRPLSMCNCCSCCCICLNTLARNESYLATPSRFIAEVAHPDRCVGCGKCAASCQMSAVEFSDAGVSITAGCVGCGHCVVKCPAGVLRMKLKPGAPEGPARDRFNRIYL